MTPREMQQAIYEQHLQAGTADAYIAQRKEDSAAKFAATRKRQQERKALLKQGREYIHKNKAFLLRGGFYHPTAMRLFEDHPYPVVAGALLKTDRTTTPNTIYYRCAYTIQSRKDNYTNHVSAGVVGARLQDDYTGPYAFNIRMNENGSIKPQRLARLIETHILMDLLAPRVPGPQRLIVLAAKNPVFLMLRICGE